MLTTTTRKEKFGTILYNPSKDRFFLNSSMDLAQLSQQHLSAPLTLHWLVTLRCNARCPYCYLLPNLLNPYEDEKILSEKEAEQSIGQIANAGTPRLYLTGGEPTLHPFLDKILSIAYENNIKCVVNTNGIRMPSKVYEALAAYQSRLSISLDSHLKEEHNKSRRQNSFDSIVEILQRSSQDNLDVRVISVLQQTNEAYWINFGKFLGSLGVKNWFIQSETTQEKNLSTAKLEAKLLQEFPQMRIRVLPAIFDSFLYMLPDGKIGSDFWTPQRKVYGQLPLDHIEEIWGKNEKNTVGDHQGILHINTSGGLQ